MKSNRKLFTFSNFFDTLNDLVRNVDQQQLSQLYKLITRLPSSAKLIFAGNGGSAAMASHLAVDFTKAAGIRAVNFNEADLITCYSNDYGYENWIVKALESYADSDDIVTLISSSGKSPNIINAASYCRENNVKLVTLSGFSSDNPLRRLGDINFWVDSSEYNIVEMTHHIWLLAIVDYIVAHKD